jgi:hypothetical protein
MSSVASLRERKSIRIDYKNLHLGKPGRNKAAEIVQTDSSRIAMPLSHKWQTIIDDTLFPIRHPVGSYVGYFFRCLYIQMYIHVYYLLIVSSIIVCHLCDRGIAILDHKVDNNPMDIIFMILYMLLKVSHQYQRFDLSIYG